MKQYTTPEQTAKLIELGIVPKRIQSVSDEGKMLLELMGFPIGELIEMLPRKIGNGWYILEIKVYLEQWKVVYTDITNDSPRYYIVEDDLIDAIFNMAIKLKEEGVI